MPFPRHLVKQWGAELGWKCEVCFRLWHEGWILEGHHIIPTYAGGKNTRINFRLLCIECHYKAHEELRVANIDHPSSSKMVYARLKRTNGRWK